MKHLAHTLRTQPRHRRAMRLTILTASAALTCVALVQAAPFYWSFGVGFAFCFERLPSIEPCPIDPIIVEDMEICFGISGNTMGNNQARLNVDNIATVSPVFAVAVAVNDDALTSATNDGVQQDWETALVSRATWDAGFTFPGSAGVWVPPNTVGTFDALFGVSVNQAAVYWVSATQGAPIAAGLSNNNFFIGPANSTTPLLPANTPVVAWGNGLQLYAGQAPIHTLQQLGFTHAALGSAQLSSDAAGRVVVSNIGSSGLDGVSIDLGQAQGWGADMEQVAPVPFGSFYDITMLGQVNATANQPIVKIRTQDASTAVDSITNVTTTFFNLPTTVHVTLFDLTGALIGEYNTNSPSNMVITEEGVPAIKARPRGTTCEPNGDGGIIDTGGNSIVTEVGTAFTFTGVSTIRVQGVNPAAVVDFASTVVITGTNTNDLRFTTEKLQSATTFFKPVSSAQFNTTSTTFGQVGVSNMGIDGTDGFIVDPREVTTGVNGARDITLSWDPIVLCDSIAPPPPTCNPGNTSLRLRSTGVVGGVSDVVLGSLLIQNNSAALGSGIQISATSAPSGSPSLQIVYYSAGALVGTLTGVPNGFIASAPSWPIGGGVSDDNIGALNTYADKVYWAGDLALDFGPFGVIVADELRILAENPASPIDHVETLEVLMSETHDIVLTSVVVNPFTTTFDLDSNGIVGPADLATLLGQWGNPYNASDLAGLLGSWGPNP